MIHPRSYRPRFREHAVAELQRQIRWGEEVNLDAEKLFQLLLQAAQVEERRPRQRVDQQIEVAAVSVRSVER